MAFTTRICDNRPQRAKHATVASKPNDNMEGGKMSKNQNDGQQRSVLSDVDVSQLLITVEGEALCALMLGFDDSGEGAFRGETGFDPTAELSAYLDVQISLAIGKLVDEGKKYFLVVLNEGIVSRMAHCCARIRDDATDPRSPALWVVTDAEKLSACTPSEEQAIHEADRVLAIRAFDEERVTDELVCGCGAILSVFSHPENVPTLEGAASAEIEIININPAESLAAYTEQKKYGGKPAPQ